MQKTRIIFGSVGIIIIFVLIGGGNAVKNIANSQPSTIIVSSPSNISQQNIILTQQQVISSYFAPNQTQAIQETIQNQLLSTTTQDPVDESVVVLTVEKINNDGTITDRVNSNIPDLFDIVTAKDSFTDLSGWKLKIGIEIQTKNSGVSLSLSGTIKTIVNDFDYEVKTLTITGDSGQLKTKKIRIGSLDSYEIPMNSLKQYFIEGNNKVVVKIESVSGVIGTKNLNKNNIILYESDFDYSANKIIVLTESGVKAKIYPKDSSLTLGSSAGIIYNTYCQSFYRGTWNCAVWGGSYDSGSRYPAPLLTNVKVFDSDNNLILNRPDLTGTSVTIPLFRNEQYHVIIASQNLDYFINTPEDSTITYDYQCVGTSNGVSCGHP